MHTKTEQRDWKLWRCNLFLQQNKDSSESFLSIDHSASLEEYINSSVQYFNYMEIIRVMKMAEWITNMDTVITE
jgi:hypothetical protein